MICTTANPGGMRGDCRLGLRPLSALAALARFNFIITIFLWGPKWGLCGGEVRQTLEVS